MSPRLKSFGSMVRSSWQPWKTGTGKRQKAEGTYVAVPDIGFSDRYDLDMGDVKIELRYFGPGHSPGDIALWIPQDKLLITGDLGFHQRLLAVFDDTVTGTWIESFDKLSELNPAVSYTHLRAHE